MKPAVSLARVGLGLEGFSEEVMVEGCPLRQEKARELIHFPLQIREGELLR